MKKIVYKLINKFGFKVENKKKFIEREKELLKKYNIKWRYFTFKYNDNRR